MTHLHHNEPTAILPNVAFIGKAGAGKTSAADILNDHYFYVKRSIAGPLKEIAGRLWGPNPGRDKHQRLGVAVRAIDSSTWVNLLVSELDDGPTLPAGLVNHRVVVDDVRFPNEFDVLRSHGFVVVRIEASVATRIDRLKRNGKWQSEDQLEHESETALDLPGYEADYTIRNEDNPDALLDGLLDVLNKERR